MNNAPFAAVTQKRVQLVALATTHPRTYRETCTTCRTYRARQKSSNFFVPLTSCTSCTRFCVSCTMSSTQFYKLYTFPWSSRYLGVAAMIVVVILIDAVVSVRFSRVPGA